MTSDKEISPLKQALKAQFRNLFQKRRYWFHIIIWVIAFCFLAFSVISDPFEKGLKKGINDAQKNKTTSVTIYGDPPKKEQKRDITISSRNMINGSPLEDVTTSYISLLSIIAAAVMVYSFLLFFIPYARYKKKKRYIWIGVIVNIAFWITIIITVAIILGIKSETKKNIDTHDIVLIVLLSTFFSGIVTGYFFALYYFIDLYDQQKNLSTYKTALTERVEAETAFLRNQINPHFLFNTLNNIYSLLLNQSPDAVFVTKELKNMMQYMLEECAKEKVPLAGEISFLKNYINLEKLRNQKEQVHVKFNVTGQPGDKEIAPLLLINFLENAFKHGVKAGFNEAYVNVHIDIKDQKLTLQMENSKPPVLEITGKSIKEDSGIGIVNVKRRLDILYPKRYKLNLQDTPNQYVVLLSIEL